MSKAIYAFSGDPITYGHLDVITRACRVFDEVIVAIGVNPDKNYMFSLDERTMMAKKSLDNIPGVRVVSFRGLLVDYAYEHDIPVILKGLRNSKDFDYELTLHQMTKSQQLDIDTFFLPAKQDLVHVSSSSAKALQLEQGLIHDYVHLYVKQCLEAKVSGQYIIGVTGEIGTGKSYLCRCFEKIGKERNIEVLHIELDHIGHRILSNLDEPLYRKVRQAVFRTFGRNLQLPDGSVDRKKLGEIVFNDAEKLDQLNEIIYPPMLLRLRRDLYRKKGLILFNAALIAESNLSHLCNNNIVLVTAGKETQRKRLYKRNLTNEQIEKRLGSQYNAGKKLRKIKQNIHTECQGNVWEFDNSGNAGQEEFENLFDGIIHYVDVHGELRFKALYKRAGILKDFEFNYKSFIKSYSVQPRYYNTLATLLTKIETVDKVKHLLTNRDIVELAMWYSRVIHDTKNNDSIEQSARFANSVLTKAGLPANFCSKTAYYIRCLNHKNLDLKDDAVFVVDIDLAVLGSKKENFKKYEQNIRKEFFRIEKEQYCALRRTFYTELSGRSRIYQTNYFYTRYEEKARRNMEWWLKENV